MWFIIDSYRYAASWNWLENGLLSYYKCDTNGSFPDNEGNNNGTINWATYTASWFINGAYNFDWTNDRVDIGTFTFNASQTDLSFSVWMKSSGQWASWWYLIWERNDTTTDWAFLQVLSAGTILFGVRWNTVGTITSTTTVVDNNWHHIVWTYSENWTQELYIDAGSEWSIAWSALDWSSIPMEIWRRRTGASTYYTWDIDEVWIRNVELTSDQVTDLYNSWSWLPRADFTS